MKVRRARVGREGGVGEVGNSFSGGAEGGWTVNPAHRQDHREGDKRGTIGGRRKDDPEMRNVRRVQMDSVKTVGDVDFDDIRWAMTRIGIANALEKSMEGAAKLHGLGSSERYRLRVNTVEGVIDDGARTSIRLRHDSHGAEAEAWKVCCGADPGATGAEEEAQAQVDRLLHPPCRAIRRSVQDTMR